MDGTLFEDTRNNRPPTFDRSHAVRPSLTPTYEFGQNAWNTSGSIWRNETTRFERNREDMMGSGTMRSVIVQNGIQPESLSHLSVPQEHSSPVADRKSNLSGLSLDLNDLRGVSASQPASPWGPPTSNTSFVPRPHGSIASPVKQKPTGTLTTLASGTINAADQFSLLNGSAPDVEDQVQNPPLLNRRLTATAFRVTGEQSDSNQQFSNHRSNSNSESSTMNPSMNSIMFGSNGSLPLEEFGSSASGSRKGMGNNDMLYHVGERSHAGARSQKIQSLTMNGNNWPSTNGSEQLEFSNTMAYKNNGRNYYSDYGNGFSSSMDTVLADTAQSIDNFHFHSELSPPENNASLRRPVFETQRRPYDAQGVQAPFVHPRLQLPYLSGPRRSDPSTYGMTRAVDPQLALNNGSFSSTSVSRSTTFNGTSEYRSNAQSPVNPPTVTPPTGPASLQSTTGSRLSSRTSNHDPVLLDYKLRDLESERNSAPILPHNGLPTSAAYPLQFDYPIQASGLRSNPLASSFMVPDFGSMSNYSLGTRNAVRESESSQIVRSPLLEEFRMNSRTNKRYELKDLYNHIVEFSGDQHGSRFIQQKLETANSDEKDQVFKEIQPNSLQLMTDVFGNYVIQKLFEHGSQAQKKTLAHQMKGHVLHLSTQMYGCRVVQKALEHVLTDQQATLIKELDGPHKQILKVIKDQNGNHVVQKAIERVPAADTQFIVEAHKGQVVKLATHPYGCRVIQRILEFCQPPAKRVILDELHGCVGPLITDSFGNYVIQHVIQNGEHDDRRRVVTIVQQQALPFSKHKFASNVVEKCIEFADDDQRADILRQLIGKNEQGQTPVLGLLRDQYGNYVIQKIHSLLHGAELEALVTEMKESFPHLRRTSYGKQVMAIEKLLYGTAPPSLTTSRRSSTMNSTNASSMADGTITPPTAQFLQPLKSNGKTMPVSLGLNTLNS